jgi:restriction system protein
MWAIRAGRTDDGFSLFTKDNEVGLGWSKVGDLSKIPKDRESFKAAVAAAYPDHKAGAIPGDAGMLLRFSHEMMRGDLIVYPAKTDRTMYVGEVAGDYIYRPDQAQFPHRRPVKWLKKIPRTALSQGALYELGSALSFFRVKDYAEEIQALCKGTAAPAPKTETDATVDVVADAIEDNTRTYILKVLAQELKGHAFAHFVAHLLRIMGYRTRVSPQGPDGGVDIIAHRDELGFEPPLIKVQVKSTEGSVGDPVVSALYGKVGNGEFGLLVTLGTITKQAVSFATGKSNLRLLDGDAVVDLVLEHYEQLESTYKGVLRLKRVYVPQPAVDEDD